MSAPTCAVLLAEAAGSEVDVAPHPSSETGAPASGVGMEAARECKESKLAWIAWTLHLAHAMHGLVRIMQART